MSRVRNRDTQPEIRVRSLLHRAGYRFRLQRRDLPGRPDIYLPKYRLAVFVHGCFWHGHEGCKRSRLPETRAEFWAAKIDANKRRDERAIEELASLGILSVTLWECQLKDGARIIDRITEVIGEKAGTDGEKTAATGTGCAAPKSGRTSDRLREAHTSIGIARTSS